MEKMIELYERYEDYGGYSRVWWEENMPENTKFKPTYKYRRRYSRIDDIDCIIAIEGNKDECVVRFYSSEEIVVKADYDEICIEFNDLCNSNLEP
jgi:hypothetical protein